MTSTSDSPTTEAPALPLPDRERVLEHAAELIAEAWRSFDQPRRAEADRLPRRLVPGHNQERERVVKVLLG